jgi:hypothetical protein
LKNNKTMLLYLLVILNLLEEMDHQKAIWNINMVATCLLKYAFWKIPVFSSLEAPLTLYGLSVLIFINLQLVHNILNNLSSNIITKSA